jgi:hypothetical protein
MNFGSENISHSVKLSQTPRVSGKRKKSTKRRKAGSAI